MCKRNRAQVFCLLFLLLGVISCVERLDDSARVEKARNSISAKDFRSAIFDLRLLEEKSAENSEILMLLGIAYEGYGNFESAVAYFEQALDDGRELGEFRIPFAEALLQSRQFERALEIADPAQGTTREEKITLWLLQGDVLVASESFVEALKCYSEARKLEENSNVSLLRAAEVFWENGNFLDARDFAERALRMDSSSLQSRWMLAEILSDQGDTSGAVDVYQHALATLDLEDRDIGYFLADMAASQVRHEDLEGARKTLNELTAIWPAGDKFPKFIEGQIALLDGNYSDAVQFSQIYLTEYPDRTETSLVLGEAHFRLGHIYQAESHLKDAIDEDPNNSHAKSTLALVYVAQGRVDYALDTLAKDVRSGINNSQALALFGLVEFLATENKSALEIRDFVIDADSQAVRDFAEDLVGSKTDNVAGLCLLGLSDLHEGDFSAAMSSFRAALEFEPQNSLLLRSQALVYLAKGDPRSGIKVFEKLPFDALARGLLLDTLQSEHDQVFAADSHVRNWLNNRSSDHEMRLWFAWSLLVRGEFEEAAGQYEVLLKEGQATSKIHSNLARAYQSMGDSRALDHARTASEIEGENAYVLDTYGSILVSNEELDAGIENYRKARYLEPGNGMLAYRLADALLRKGEKTEASQLLTELIDHDDDRAATLARGRLETVRY